MLARILIVGSTGAIGQGFVTHLAARYPEAQLFACGRSVTPGTAGQVHYLPCDMQEAGLATVAKQIADHGPLDRVVVATGVLHDSQVKPEKSLQDLNAAQCLRVFEINTVLPALCLKYFLPLCHKQRRAVFAILSARVGSITDNQLGGWYAYRASKAALNMIIKNAAIEAGRFHPEQYVVGLHPGTVDSHLSAPFQQHLPPGQCRSAAEAVAQLTEVMDGLVLGASGRCFDYRGQEVLP